LVRKKSYFVHLKFLRDKNIFLYVDKNRTKSIISEVFTNGHKPCSYAYSSLNHLRSAESYFFYNTMNMMSMRIFTSLLLVVCGLFGGGCPSVLAQTIQANSPEVVINKYRNGGDSQIDTVEILVIRDGADLRGYVVRDFAISNTLFTADSITAGTGSFRFSNAALWQRLRAGTILVLPLSSEAALLQSDTVVTVGLNNTMYFSTQGKFDIGASDMVMVKRPGAPIQGTEGNVHAFAAGLTTRNVAGIVPCLFTSSDAGGATPTAIPDNTFGTLEDYRGSRAATVAVAKFGSANNVANQRFIDSLRRTRTTSVRNMGIKILNVSPLPASNECVVRFTLEASSLVVMWVTDMKGARQELHRASLEAGEQHIRLALNGLHAGAYFLTVRTNVGEW
jgi:hypothetical protein